MGEYCEKAFSDVKKMLDEENKHPVRYSLKGTANRELFSYSIVRKIEDFIDKNLPLSQDEKTGFLNFLNETLTQSYNMFHDHIVKDSKLHEKMWQLIEDYERENHLNWRKIVWGILVACLVCSGIVCLCIYSKK